MIMHEIIFWETIRFNTANVYKVSYASSKQKNGKTAEDNTKESFQYLFFWIIF